MKRDSEFEQDRQTRLKSICKFKKYIFNERALKRVYKAIIATDSEALISELKKMYNFIDMAKPNHFVFINTAEFLSDTYFKLIDRITDRQSFFEHLVYVCNKEIRRLEVLDLVDEMDALADITFEFTKEIGKVRNEKKIKSPKEEFISDNEINEFCSYLYK